MKKTNGSFIKTKGNWRLGGSFTKRRSDSPTLFFLLFAVHKENLRRGNPLFPTFTALTGPRPSDKSCLTVKPKIGLPELRNQRNLCNHCLFTKVTENVSLNNSFRNMIPLEKNSRFKTSLILLTTPCEIFQVMLVSCNFRTDCQSV